MLFRRSPPPQIFVPSSISTLKLVDFGSLSFKQRMKRFRGKGMGEGEEQRKREKKKKREVRIKLEKNKNSVALIVQF